VRLALRVRGGCYALDWDGAALLRLDAEAGNAAPLAVACRGESHLLRPGASLVVRLDGEAEAGREARSVAE
jgi:hypothetical protein